jgi:uncharacterized protein (TIGR00295 family)
MITLPASDECIKMLKESGCTNEVISHSKAVRNIAVKIAKAADANIRLVESGALIHDIGRSKTHGLRHAIEGVKIGKKLGLPREILNIIERHIGAGLSSEEAKKLGLPKKDYIPLTLEEKIVCHADNLVDNNKKRKIEDEIERALDKGNSEYARRLVALHKELSEICGFDVNKI